jgi:hypothetical protein
MLARVATFEGGSPDGIRAAAEELKSNIPQGPPPGIKSSGLTMLIDPDGGRVMFIGLFDSEEDLRESESALEEMDTPEGAGRRTSVAVYEVGAEVRM